MDEGFEQHDEGSRYVDTETIGGMALYQALSNLVFFSDDVYLRSQAQNLNVVDQFLMPLEYKVLRELTETGRSPDIGARCIARFGSAGSWGILKRGRWSRNEQSRVARRR